MHTTVTLSFIVLLLAPSGCGSREVPAEFPAGSAASEQTSPGPLLSPVALAPASDSEGHHDHSAASGHDADHGEKKPSADALYVCPMHPEVTSHDPGTCPKCGMTLELQQ